MSPGKTLVLSPPVVCVSKVINPDPKENMKTSSKPLNFSSHTRPVFHGPHQEGRAGWKSFPAALPDWPGGLDRILPFSTIRNFDTEIPLASEVSGPPEEHLIEVGAIWMAEGEIGSHPILPVAFV